jgi:hypothetical protein
MVIRHPVRVVQQPDPEPAPERTQRDDETLRLLGVIRSQTRKFNPAQPRDPHSGEWLDTTPGDGAFKDALKLAGRIELEPGERLLGSASVKGDKGTIRLAVIERDGVRSLRLGIGGPTFGGRDDEAGPWRAGPDPTWKINADRKRLAAEQKSIEAELGRLDDDPNADPKRKAALTARLEELDDAETLEISPDGYTANLDAPAAQRLRATLSEAADAGAKAQADVDAYYDKLDSLEAKATRLQSLQRVATPAEEAQFDKLVAQINELKAQGRPAGPDYQVFAEGSVPGEWADVHYEVYLDDPSVGVEMILAAVPPGSTFEELSGSEQAANLDPAEARKFLRLLGEFT